MEILFMRHGKTASNETGRYCGRTDEPLSREGFAAAYATRLPDLPETVYVSPMLRAIQTAQILFPHAVLVPVKDLREMDFGAFEGRNANEMEQDEAYRLWVENDCLTRCPGGENMEEFSARTCLAFDGLVRQAMQNEQRKLVIVAHGGTIMSILDRYAYPRRAHYYEWSVRNCCGYRARLRTDQWPDAPRLVNCRPVP